MHTSVSRPLVAAVSVGSLLLSGSLTLGQSNPPDKSRGVSRSELATIDLSSELDGFAGRVLRQHRTTIEPGGIIAIHDHVERPEIILVFSGRLTDHQGEATKEYLAGQSYAVGRKTRHWLENRGTEPAVFIATSVVKAQ